MNRKVKKGFLFLFNLKLLQEKDKTQLFNNDLSKRNSANISIPLKDCHMKNSWIFFRKLELPGKPLRRPNLGVALFYLIPRRYHFKQYQLDYQPLFRKGAQAIRPEQIEQWKSSLKMDSGVSS